MPQSIQRCLPPCKFDTMLHGSTRARHTYQADASAEHVLEHRALLVQRIHHRRALRHQRRFGQVAQQHCDRMHALRAHNSSSSSSSSSSIRASRVRALRWRGCTECAHVVRACVCVRAHRFCVLARMLQSMAQARGLHPLGVHGQCADTEDGCVYIRGQPVLLKLSNPEAATCTVGHVHAQCTNMSDNCTHIGVQALA